MNWRAILKKSSLTPQEYQENQEYQNISKFNITDIPDITAREENKKSKVEPKLKTNPEILNQAKYLFYERFGISNNLDLALDESFKYLIDNHQ